MKTYTYSKKPLIRKYHALASKLQMNDEQKHDFIYDNFGVESSTELNVMQLQELCNELEKLANPKLAELDKLRKRLIGSIFGWLKSINKEGNIEYVKAIACRAAGKEIGEFNKIPADRLRSLYNSFRKQKKDINTIEILTHMQINELINAN